MPKMREYLSILFSTFFRWWWAAIAGAASIASWAGLPAKGVVVPQWAAVILVFAAFLLLFLAATTLYEGWVMYAKGAHSLRVTSVQASAAYGGSHVVLINASGSFVQGTLLELTRTVDGVQEPIALVELHDRNDDGYYQANPVWFAPVHLADLKTNQLNYSQIGVRSCISGRALTKCRQEVDDG